MEHQVLQHVVVLQLGEVGPVQGDARQPVHQHGHQLQGYLTEVAVGDGDGVKVFHVPNLAEVTVFDHIHHMGGFLPSARYGNSCQSL